jgi:hypothetical protein
MIERNYSMRSASVGLIRLARLAGNRQATRAATPRMIVAPGKNLRTNHAGALFALNKLAQSN